jgi:hypothetical protein
MGGGDQDVTTMASNNQVEAGGAFVKIWADNNPLERTLNASAAMLGKWGQKITGIGQEMGKIGAAITAPLLLAAKLSADAGSKIFDMSRRTGIGAEALQVFGYAAEQTGGSLEGMESVIKRMQKSIAGIADETEGTTGKLEELGISAAQIKGLSPDKQFELIASKLKAIKDPTERAAAAMKIFGKSGTDVLPMIEEFGELSARAKALGFIRTDEDIADADALGDAFHDLKRATMSIAATVTAAMTPSLKAAADWLLRASIGARTFAANNQPLIVGALKLGAALTVGGAALFGIGKAMSAAGVALKIIAPALGVVLSPIGLVIGGLTGLAAYVLYTSDMFKHLKGVAGESLKGIGNALMKGDIKLASEILWTSLEIGWLEFKGFLDGLFNAMADNFVSAWIKASAKAQEIFVRMQAAFTSFTNSLGDKLKISELTEKRDRAQATLDSSFKNPENIVGNKVGTAEGEAKLKAYREQKRKEIDEAQKSIDYIRDMQSRETNREAQEKIDAINKERDAQLKALEDLRNKGGDQADIEERTRRLAELVEQLRKLNQAADGGSSPAPPTAPRVPNLTGGVGDPTQTRSSFNVGTFNANQIFGLSGGRGPNRDIADIKNQVATIARTLWGRGGSVAGGGQVVWS